MATLKVGAHPELTAERAMEVFQRNFQGKYQVQRTKSSLGTRDFVLKKDGWTGVGVKVKHADSSTTFVFTGMIPSMLNRMLFGGLVEVLWLRRGWRKMEQEIATFIQAAPEFK